MSLPFFFPIFEERKFCVTPYIYTHENTCIKAKEKKDRPSTREREKEHRPYDNIHIRTWKKDSARGRGQDRESLCSCAFANSRIYIHLLFSIEMMMALYGDTAFGASSQLDVESDVDYLHWVCFWSVSLLSAMFLREVFWEKVCRLFLEFFFFFCYTFCVVEGVTVCDLWWWFFDCLLSETWIFFLVYRWDKVSAGSLGKI